MAIKHATSATAGAPVALRARSTSLPQSSSSIPTKAALLIGCQYQNNKDHDNLIQPHSDVLKMNNLLMKVYHFEKTDITMLLDDGKHEAPTKANILKEVKKLVVNAKSGDTLFFLFSGHGEQTPCHPDDKTEIDGMDEAIVPCDATGEKESWIIDNDLNKLLVRKIPVDAQLIAVLDMCHSGTAMDLKHYCYNDGEEPSRSETPSSRSSFHQSAVHVCKRTSLDTVESETRRLNELPSALDPSSASADHTAASDGKKDDPKSQKAVRRYSYSSRKSMVRCEFSEGSETSSLAQLQVQVHGDGEPVITEMHRMNSCADCGGLLGREPETRDAEHVDLPRDEDRKEYQDEGGFVPARPTSISGFGLDPQLSSWNMQRPKRRRTIFHTADGDREQTHEQDAPIIRRHTDFPLRRERKYGCLSTLQPNWLYHLLKQKLGKLAHGGEGKDKKIDNVVNDREDHINGLPSRTPTETSITPLMRPTSSIPASPVSIAPLVISTIPLKARADKRLSAPRLGAIQEDRQTSLFSDPENEILRCTSPKEMDLNGSMEVVGVVGTESPALQAFRSRDLTRTLRSAQVLKRRKCNCRSPSVAWPDHGQVIHISAAGDEQVAWETSKGSLTSALVDILEKDAHPSYKNLMSSLQLVLNTLSDEVRRTVDREKKRIRIRKCVASRSKQQQQKRGLQRSESAVTPSTSASGTTSRRSSKKSGDDIGQDIMNTLEQAVKDARGGPVQRAMIGTEIHTDLTKERFMLFRPRSRKGSAANSNHPSNPTSDH